MIDHVSHAPADENPLVGRAAARLVLAKMAEIEPADTLPAVTRSELWAHAQRRPDMPVNLAVVRALRSDPEAARLYRSLLSLTAVAYSEMAAAAYDSSATHRRIGSFELDVVEEDDAPPTLIIQLLSDKVAAPTLIEVVSLEGVVRLPLPSPVDGHIVMDLPRQDAERDLMRLMLANPLSGVYLL